MHSHQQLSIPSHSWGPVWLCPARPWCPLVTSGFSGGLHVGCPVSPGDGAGAVPWSRCSRENLITFRLRLSNQHALSLKAGDRPRGALSPASFSLWKVDVQKSSV